MLGLLLLHHPPHLLVVLLERAEADRGTAGVDTLR
jgi:hypothetical protein